MYKIISLILLQFTTLFLFAQDDNHLQYDDYIYNEAYKSVQLYQTGDAYSQPIIDLKTNQTLTLSFDDLTLKSISYAYTFILCNADWTPADMQPMEYIDGMTEGYFNSSITSLNTTIRYTHYKVELPNNNIKITKSGNYILKVYPEGESDNPIITKRFYVYDKKVEVVSQYNIAQSPQYRNSYQEIEVKVNLNNYPMPDIYQNFKMIIKQNGRKDNKIIRNTPRIMNQDFLYFNLPNDILFEAGNEFRSFDIRTLKTQTAKINTIKFDSAGYQVDLLNDRSRLGKNYLKYGDLNGNYAVIDWDNDKYSDQIEADYAFVNFSFKSDSIIKNGGIYLLGALTNWKLDNSSRLAYDKLKNEYTTTLLLKQGYYDYQYIYLPNNEEKGTVIPFEGSFSETSNDYTVFIYYRDQGAYYDKLIGLDNVKFE